MLVNLEKWQNGKKIWIETDLISVIAIRPVEYVDEKAKGIVISGKEKKPTIKEYSADLVMSGGVTVSTPFHDENEAVDFLRNVIEVNI